MSCAASFRRAFCHPWGLPSPQRGEIFMKVVEHPGGENHIFSKTAARVAKEVFVSIAIIIATLGIALIGIIVGACIHCYQRNSNNE